MLAGSSVLEGKLVQWGRKSLMLFSKANLLLYWDIRPVSDPHKEDEVVYLLPIRLRTCDALGRALARMHVANRATEHGWNYKQEMNELLARQLSMRASFMDWKVSF